MGYLRTLLALTVVLAHSPWAGGFVFVGGRNAVQLFYIVSGFLIAHVLCTNPTYRGCGKFYLNRALRIYPLYYGVALLTILSAPLLNPGFLGFYRQLPASANAFLAGANALIFGQDWVLFSGIDAGRLVFAADFTKSDVLLYRGLLVPQGWTLGLELTFYALAPFILRRARLIWLLLALSIGVRVALLAAGLGARDPWTYRFFPAELALFLLGALANHYLLPFWQRHTRGATNSALPAAATAALAVLIIFYSRVPFGDGIKTAILFTFFMILLPLTFIYQDHSKADRAVGELSYAIYVSHFLVIRWASYALNSWGMNLSPLPHSLLNVVLSCVIAYALNRLVADRVATVRATIRGVPAVPAAR